MQIKIILFLNLLILRIYAYGNYDLRNDYYSYETKTYCLDGTKLMCLVLANDIGGVEKYLAQIKEELGYGDLNARDKDGNTALMLAVKNLKDDIGALLINAHAAIDIKDRFGNHLIDEIVRSGCVRTFEAMCNNITINKKYIPHLLKIADDSIRIHELLGDFEDDIKGIRFISSRLSKN